MKSVNVHSMFAAMIATLTCVAVAPAAVTTQVLYNFGDDGAIGANNLPLDSSGNGRDIENPIGTPTITLSGGPQGDAYYTFSGAEGSYFFVGSYDPPEDNVGVEAWVRTSNLTQNNSHVIGTGSNVEGLGIGFEAGGGRGWFGAVGGQSFIGDPGAVSYTAGEWVHLAVVRDGGMSTFYANGVAVGGPIANTPNDANDSIHIGVTSGGSAFFDGDIAYARIFTFNQGEFGVGDLNTAVIPAPAALPAGLTILAFASARRRRRV